ncbi:thioredoxin domain-containing protein [Chloroflexus sp.]|uniref:thioredoxin domain-containing protein n=1 Tax=Chloroflexus sp. TaxID=1904827 RepID=UPI0026205151|nr:thioredoxin domain-containing protein [uncultured Chloroflexus sp.]
MNLSEFQARLRTYDLPVVVDIWAPWCLPCRVTRPVLQRLAQTYQGQVALWEINAEAHPELLRDLKVYGIPTLIVYRDGQEIIRHIGAKAEAELSEMFHHLAEGKTPPRISARERLIRIVVALVLAVIAWSGGVGWPLFVLAGLVLFSAVYDRCPVWQTITSWMRGMSKKQDTERVP